MIFSINAGVLVHKNNKIHTLWGVYTVYDLLRLKYKKSQEYSYHQHPLFPVNHTGRNFIIRQNYSYTKGVNYILYVFVDGSCSIRDIKLVLRRIG